MYGMLPTKITVLLVKVLINIFVINRMAEVENGSKENWDPGEISY